MKEDRVNVVGSPLPTVPGKTSTVMFSELWYQLGGTEVLVLVTSLT